MITKEKIRKYDEFITRRNDLIENIQEISKETGLKAHEIINIKVNKQNIKKYYNIE